MRQKLVNILSTNGAADILAIAALSYAYQDPNAVTESENDRSPAHLEYLGLQALCVGLKIATRKPPPPDFAHIAFRALRLVRHIFGRQQLLIEIDAFTSVAGDTERAPIEYQRNTQLNSMNVRINAFPHHIRDVTQSCFENLNDQCRQILEFTAEDVIRVSDAVVDSRLLEHADAFDEYISIRNELQRQYTRTHEGKAQSGFPAWIPNLSFYDARLALDILAWSNLDTTTLASFTCAEIAAAADIPPPVASRILSAFSASQQDFVTEHHAFPIGAHPLTTMPVLSYADRYLVPAPQMLLEAIRPRMEALINRPNTTLSQQYITHRSRYLEEKSTELLKLALPGASSWTQVKWHSDGAEGELDGLVHLGDVTLQIQCKSGKVTAGTRRGSDRHMTSDVKKLISKATEQHQTLMKALAMDPSMDLNLSSSQIAALRSPMQFQVVVTLDDIVVWGTLASRLKTIGRLPAGREIPWVLSLTDLMVVVDMLEHAELVDYVVRRQRLERDGRVIAHDELDWLGHYITNALCLESLAESATHERPAFLPTQSEQFDAWYSYDDGRRDLDTRKPRSYVPTALRELIGRLELERPEHWILASIILLDGDRAAQVKLAQEVNEVNCKVQSGSYHGVNRVLHEVCLTYHVNHQVPTSQESTIAHSSEREADSGIELWISIGVSSDQKLSINVHNSRPLAELMNKFLDSRV